MNKNHPLFFESELKDINGAKVIGVLSFNTKTKLAKVVIPTQKLNGDAGFAVTGKSHLGEGNKLAVASLKLIGAKIFKKGTNEEIK
jgi:hypothetical protein